MSKPQIIVISDFDAVTRKCRFEKLGVEAPKEHAYHALTPEEAAGAPLPKEKPRQFDAPEVNADSLSRILGMMEGT